MVLTEALMVLGIVLQIHAGARVSLPARLNTPYDAVGGAAAARGDRDLVAVRDERLGDGAADPPVAAGDQDGPGC